MPECAICISASGMFHRVCVLGLSMAVRSEAIGERLIRSRAMVALRSGNQGRGEGAKGVEKKAMAGGLPVGQTDDASSNIAPFGVIKPPLPLHQSF